MRLTRLITLSFLGLSTASVINPQARSSSVTNSASTPNIIESALLVQTNTEPSESPMMARDEPSPTSPRTYPAANAAIIVEIDLTDFDEEDQNENTQHHGGHGGGHGGHGRGHSSSSHSGDGSNGGSSGTRGGGAAVAAGGSASGKKNDGARSRPEMLGVAGVVMMGFGVLMG